MKYNNNIYIYIYIYFSWSQSFCGVLERHTETGRQRDIAILTHNIFFSWPYRAENSVVWDIKTPVSPCTSQARVSKLRSWETQPPAGRSKWLQAGCDLGPHLLNWQTGICIYHFITPTTSDRSRKYFRFFHRCVFFREISDGRFG